MMVGAFAHLFNLGGDMEHPLGREVVTTLQPRQEILATAARRGIAQPPGGPGVSVREAWIRDFVRARHPHAHGQREGRRGIWLTKEHLLLGAFAFPLVVKVLLSRPPLALYTLTDDDHAAIEMFESLAAEDAFVQLPAPDRRQQPQFGWERIRQRYRDERLAEVVRRGYEEARQREAGPNEVR
jgi:hypothetical protein